MAKKKEEKIDLNNIPEEEKIKYEIAGELGLLDRVAANGWKACLQRKRDVSAGL